MAEVTTEYMRYGRNRLNYPAIFAGVIVAFSLLFFLNVLGNAIGLKLVNPVNIAGERLSTGTVLWSLGIPLGVFLIGGYVASAVGRANGHGLGALHGLLVWGLSFMFLMGIVGLMSAGPTTGTAGPKDVYWLSFFSICLQIIGATFGGYLGAKSQHYESTSRVDTTRRVTV